MRTRNQLNAMHRKYRARVAAQVQEYKMAHPCVDCGESDPIVLEFDHLPGLEKLRSPIALAGGGITAVFAEIAKCEMVCANCHARRTHARGQLHKGR